jgi:hypothetical protein
VRSANQTSSWPSGPDHRVSVDTDRQAATIRPPIPEPGTKRTHLLVVPAIFMDISTSRGGCVSVGMEGPEWRGMAVMMLLAVVTHIRRQGPAVLVFTAVLMLAAVVVAWGRFGPYSF